jgi:hypothetical protein
MKKIISFSLYGTDLKYSNGIICNIELAKIIYPDWICRIYYGTSISEKIITELKKNDNVELFLMPENENDIFQMMWRFLAIDDDDVSIMIVRDADARLSYREKKSVDLFIESDKILHSIRDNISHNDIMGGMWGIKKNNRIKIKTLMEGWTLKGYDADQKFLRTKLVPIYNDSILIHCSKYLKTFPIEPTNEYFVGGWWPADNFGKPNNYIFF